MSSFLVGRRTRSTDASQGRLLLDKRCFSRLLDKRCCFMILDRERIFTILDKRCFFKILDKRCFFRAVPQTSRPRLWKSRGVIPAQCNKECVCFRSTAAPPITSSCGLEIKVEGPHKHI